MAGFTLIAFVGLLLLADFSVLLHLVPKKYILSGGITILLALAASILGAGFLLIIQKTLDSLRQAKAKARAQAAALAAYNKRLLNLLRILQELVSAFSELFAQQKRQPPPLPLILKGRISYFLTPRILAQRPQAARVRAGTCC